jgi:hypothetical protein
MIKDITSHKKKVAKRITSNCELYKNDFEQLVNLELNELKKLQTQLLLPVIIKVNYRKRHNK